ncbi:hypothetical protein KC331_g9572 [Hortaea werneckii]|nr:hypothetical protein KC331_g9572 [Hortaea werneckii]KAI7711671.1 hypothetical protein KC353_g8817 [Hortaea werneckii]
MVKTSDIGSGRRNGLRNGEIQPRDDKERQWVQHQLRLQDLVAGRGEPMNSREADHVRLFRKQAVVQSSSAGRSTDSYQAAGSQDQASLADTPARRIKTAWIDKRRRKGLRNGEIQPQNDKERRWVEQQLRYLDLDAGRVEPADAIEADIVRQHRIAGYIKVTKENKSVDESAQAMKLEESVT